MVTIAEVTNWVDELTSTHDWNESALEQQLSCLISGVGDVALGVSQLEAAGAASNATAKRDLAHAISGVIRNAYMLAGSASIDLDAELRPELPKQPVVRWDRA